MCHKVYSFGKKYENNRNKKHQKVDRFDSVILKYNTSVCIIESFDLFFQSI